MNISVILPVLDEEKSIAATLSALAPLKPFETIVVDGGSQDRTVEIAGGFAVQIVHSERGRARQMNRGAAQASGDVLLFLHADTRLPATAFAGSPKSGVPGALPVAREPSFPSGLRTEPFTRLTCVPQSSA